MNRQLVITKDGSHTIAIPDMNVTYHSYHGAIQESQHVFIDAGLKYIVNALGKKDIHIFEMGFGTGLNALLTLIEAQKKQTKIHYTTVERFPLEQDKIDALNYCEQLQREDLQAVFEQLHFCKWEKDISITADFTLQKIQTDLITLVPDRLVNLVYYDAFAPAAQPELWTKEVFQKLAGMLEPGGILVTYCSKGEVRRSMQAAGFVVEKIPGPPGKREMVRAHRTVI